MNLVKLHKGVFVPSVWEVISMSVSHYEILVLSDGSGILNFSFIHLVRIFECLLYARHWAWPWGHNNK